MNGRQSFTPDEFLDRLRRDELSQPTVLYGMVKPDDDSDDYLFFAHGSVCQNWIRIPMTSIEAIELLNFVPCDDHTHPLVLLRLKQPETDEGRLFASLVQANSGQTRNPLSIPRQRRYDRGSFRLSRQRRLAEDAGVPHGPPAGDLLPSCSGCPAWVDDHGWFGILVECDATTCTYEEY
jgi:hypothetical protein